MKKKKNTQNNYTLANQIICSLKACFVVIEKLLSKIQNKSVNSYRTTCFRNASGLINIPINFSPDDYTNAKKMSTVLLTVEFCNGEQAGRTSGIVSGALKAILRGQLFGVYESIGRTCHGPVWTGSRGRR